MVPELSLDTGYIQEDYFKVDCNSVVGRSVILVSYICYVSNEESKFCSFHDLHSLLFPIFMYRILNPC